ncbi:MAG: hypothetical protein E6I97_09650 [Chloroflexi bacterium]|nr:MAG: hypothetical protein E6I97_09650 [Chloroflexota bacterium]
MTLDISREQARRFLALYHFMPTDVAGTMERLATVQYDPLNPVGRNSDLVFQARVPGYQVDDWQKAAYSDRLIYDAWDKQACLVPVSDWPMRALSREKYRPYHDREIVQAEAEIASGILETIDARGPLSSLEFEDRQRVGADHSWYGQTRVKRIMRSLWASGLLVTHHRKNGRHYYERPERVIPAQHYQGTPLLDVEEYLRWIISRRQQAMGLLPRSAEAAIWCSCGTGAENKVYDFDYVWEVYKPENLRRWGYYVLPVFYGDRFIARVDSRLEKGIWTIARWWWEPDVTPNAGMLDAVRDAAERFMRYLHADGVVVGEGVDQAVRQAILEVAAL